MDVAVVIPTLNRRDSVVKTLESLDGQTVRPRTFVVDNASSDGTGELVAARFPDVTLVRNEENLGFGRAIDRVALSLEGDVLVLVNNDVVCAPQFVERLLEPLADPKVGMVAGVLLQQSNPRRVDSAGIELDVTLGSWDYLWNQPVDALARTATRPVGPCGGAAAYRLAAYKELGGFDERLFAYWEDVDLAIRFQAAGWSCAFAPEATALHEHGATLGPSAAQRALHAYGRGYVMAKHGVSQRPLRRLQAALLDWPTLMVHLLVRRERRPIAARRNGLRDGAISRVNRPPRALATIGFLEALRRQGRVFRLRASRKLPTHFYGPGETES